MEIKYYRSLKTGFIEAINMENVKRIYIEFNDIDNKKVSDLYFDDIKVYSIDKDIIEKKINEFINSEEKMLEVYNSNIIRDVLRKDNSELIFKNGFNNFKEYLQSSNVNIEKVYDVYKVIGIRAWIEAIKVNSSIGSTATIDYITGILLGAIYLNSLKKVI